MEFDVGEKVSLPVLICSEQSTIQLIPQTPTESANRSIIEKMSTKEDKMCTLIQSKPKLDN